MKSRLLAPLAILAVAAAPGSAGASHQTPGCQSTTLKTGTLTSPAINKTGIGSPEVAFRTWWEIESVAPNTNDLLHVEYSINGGTTWQAATGSPLNPARPDAGAAPERPRSNIGLSQRPNWAAPSPHLDIFGASNAASVRVRFRFESVNEQRNGFRGWAIDDVRIQDEIEAGATAPLTFEGANGGAGWTFTGFWHVVSETAGVAMSPQIVPALVTLGANDNGTLPDDPDRSANGAPHTQYAWFGENATGTYCGADALVEPGTPTLALTPESAARQVGETHAITAATTNAPAGSSVRFDVSGANPGAGAAPVDPGSGTATISVLGANPGQDSVSAYLDLDESATPGPGEPTAVATVSWAAQQQRPLAIDDLEDPEPFREVNVEPIAGDVFVRLPGGAALPSGRGARASQSGAPTGFIPLREAAQIPMGSQLDTTRGRVLVESAASRTRGRTQRAQFYSGRFQLLQRRAARPITDIVLKGGTFRGCPRAKGSDADTSQRRRSRRSRVRRVWGDGRGRFRTRGRYSAATVRGTKWVVEDRCNGTLTQVARRPRSSRVVVRDFVRRRSVTVRAGRSYLAATRR
jgi:hypothetical protein